MKADSVLGSILLGAIIGVITGAIVYLGPIQWMALDLQEELALSDAIIFLAIGAFLGFPPGAVGGLLGRYAGRAVSEGKGAIIGATVGGILGGLTVCGCTALSMLGMGM